MPFWPSSGAWEAPTAALGWARRNGVQMSATTSVSRTEYATALASSWPTDPDRIRQVLKRLSSSAIRDDEFSMRGKLSHPTPAPRVRSLRSVFGANREAIEDRNTHGPFVFLAMMVLSVLLMACDRVEPRAATSAPSTSNRDDVDPGTPFAWPDDPSHPVLEIEIAVSNSTGTILIELMPELAPATVIQIIELANDGFYDGTTFHRVIPGFMIQGGDPNSRDRDPTNDGRGQPGRPLHDEFSEAPFIRGVVGMGNKGRQNSTSTQFFIMHEGDPNLDGRYTAVGRVVSGMDVVDDVTRVEIDRSGRWGPRDRPIANVVMTRVRTAGQVAAVRAALELEAESKELVQRVDERPTPRLEAPPSERSVSASSSPPAAPNTNDEWERIEALQR